MQGPNNYGDYYWCVKSNLSDNGEIYLHATRIEITQNGDILFFGKDDIIMLSIAKNNWSAFFAASLLDGAAVAVEHWPGEIIRQ